MVVKIKAYSTKSPTGGPANAAWDHWYENVRTADLKLYLEANPLNVVAVNRAYIRAFKEWLLVEYEALLDYHYEGNETNNQSELIFTDDAKATLFLMRFQ